MRDKIKQIIADSIGADVSDISDEALLHEDLGLESADVLDILDEIEATLDVPIANKNSTDIRNVEDIFELISPYMPEEL